MAPISKSNRTDSAAAWQAIFDELESADVPDDFLSDRLDNGPAQGRD